MNIAPSALIGQDEIPSVLRPKISPYSRAADIHSGKCGITSLQFGVLMEPFGALQSKVKEAK